MIYQLFYGFDEGVRLTTEYPGEIDGKAGESMNRYMAGSMRNILLVGGTGKTGVVLAELLRADGRNVRTASRRAAVGSSSCNHVEFDWGKSGNHASVLRDMDAVYLIAPTGVLEPFEVMSSFFELALQVGVRRFVLLSARIYPEGKHRMGLVHRLLHERAPEWAVLQPSWFMQNFLDDSVLRSVREHDSFQSGTSKGELAFVDARDIAAVAFHALTAERSYNSALPITGPTALSFVAAAKAISRVVGREIGCTYIDPAAHRKQLLAAGVDPDYTEHYIYLDGLLEKGAEAETTDTVLRITGRSPMSFASFVEEHADCWRVKDI